MTATSSAPISEVEAPKQRPLSKTPEKKSFISKRLFWGSLGGLALFGGIVHFSGVNKGFDEGHEARGAEVANLQKQVDEAKKIHDAEDWALDKGFRPIADQGVVLDQGNIYMRFHPQHCKAPVGFLFTGDALQIDQRDAQGHIYDSAIVDEVPELDAVTRDICA